MPEGGGPGPSELRIKLVIDDSTSETLDKVREELSGIKDTADGTKHAVEGIFSLEKLKTGYEIAHTVFETVAETMRSAYEVAERFGEAANEAATEAQMQERAMSGTLFMLDQGEHSMESIKEYSGEMRENLEKAGLAAGVGVQQMTAMFQTVVERGQLSSEEAGELTKNMAEVGKVTKGGMQGLADGFAMIELGVIRARNPIVQLIATTGVLHGNAKQVALAMTKMTPEKQMEAANEAIKRQSENMAKGGGMALTLPEIRTSLSGYREMFFEAMGRPMLDKLLPMLTDVQHWLAENADTMKEYATIVGDAFASFIQGTKEAILGVYHGIQENWKRVSATFHTLFDDWRAAWDYAVNDTDDIQSKFKSITESLVDTFSTIGRYMKAAAEVAMDIKDLFSGKDVGSTQVEMQKKAVLARAHGGTQAQYEEAVRRLHALSEDTYGPNLHNLGIRNKTGTEGTEKFIEEQSAFRKEDERRAGVLQTRVENQDVDNIGEQMRKAQIENNYSFQATALSMLTGSEAMALALEEGRIQVAGGMEAFVKSVEDHSPEVAEKFKKMLAGLHSGHVEDIKGKGGATFNIGNVTIHQDFRDQDPDRVIFAFRRDLMKHAVARTQSRVSSPFGL